VKCIEACRLWSQVGREVSAPRTIVATAYNAGSSSWYFGKAELEAHPLGQLTIRHCRSCHNRRGADTRGSTLAPQSAGSMPFSLGLRRLTNDHEMLRHGLVMYDALYAGAPPCKTKHTPGRTPVTHWLRRF